MTIAKEKEVKVFLTQSRTKSKVVSGSFFKAVFVSSCYLGLLIHNKKNRESFRGLPFLVCTNRSTEISSNQTSRTPRVCLPLF
jgi:hypothetical protein